MGRRGLRGRAGGVTALAALTVLGAGCGVLPGTGPSAPSARAPDPTTTASTTPGAVAPGGGSAQTPAVSTSPSATASPAALASKTFTVNGTYSTKARLTMRFDVVELRRRGDLLDLRATLTNTATDQSQDLRWQVAGRFNGSYRKDLNSVGGSFAGVVLTDPVGRKRYLVAADSAADCVCSANLSSTFVEAGQTLELDATYAAPPATTSTLDVAVPSLGTFRDLPIS